MEYFSCDGCGFVLHTHLEGDEQGGNCGNCGITLCPACLDSAICSYGSHKTGTRSKYCSLCAPPSEPTDRELLEFVFKCLGTNMEIFRESFKKATGWKSRLEDGSSDNAENQEMTE